MGVLVEIFRVLATVLNVTMFLSPIPTIREIYRTKSTGHMPFIPLTAMVSNAHVWMVYGWLAEDYVAIFGTCAFGVAAALVYVSIYYNYTTDRSYAHKCMALFGSVVVVNSLYAILGPNGYTGQSHDGVRKVIGYISITSSVVMYTSPLEKIRQVFQHRSAVFMPIQIVSVGAVNSATWVVYSLLDLDWMVFAPNLILLAIGLTQIALYWVFHPSKHPLSGETAGDLPLTVIKDPGSRRSSISFAVSPTRGLRGDDKDLHGDGQVFVALRSPLAPLNEV